MKRNEYVLYIQLFIIMYSCKFNEMTRNLNFFPLFNNREPADYYKDNDKWHYDDTIVTKIEMK